MLWVTGKGEKTHTHTGIGVNHACTTVQKGRGLTCMLAVAAALLDGSRTNGWTESWLASFLHIDRLIERTK